MPQTVQTPTLEIAYEASGPNDATPVVLLHGFPDDPRAYDGAVPGLMDLGLRVLVPWLRGYGPTRFLSPDTPRSGQQAALGADLLAFLDALGIGRALLTGYDWGGRAACIVSALWPERVLGLVTCGGYNIQNVSASGRPDTAVGEYRRWYQWYFNTERGVAGLTENRRDIGRLLWQLWSPNYKFDDQTFETTARSFDNADFVDVVIHSYRHRHHNAKGDPALEAVETRLVAQPVITVPTISLQGDASPLGSPAGTDRDAPHFGGRYERRIVANVGHFLPRESPEAIVRAVSDLVSWHNQSNRPSATRWSR